MTEKQNEHKMLMQFKEQDCFVDSKQKVEYPPVALSFGEKVVKSNKVEGDLIVPVALGTYGNLSVVTAPPKTKKTFFISLLASAYLSGSNLFSGDIKGHRGTEGQLVHIDTEQGLWHCQKVFERVHKMDSKIDSKIYHTFGLRSIDYKMRIEFIDYYLKEKIKSGVHVVQLFDSWGGILSPEDYQLFSWNYLQQIVTALKDHAPVIVFGKGCWFALNKMGQSGASAIGVDWTCSARNARYLSGGQITLQGNFDPTRLLSPIPEIKSSVHKMINEFGKDKYIVNLGHGILPNIPVDHAKAFVDAVKEYSI